MKIVKPVSAGNQNEKEYRSRVGEGTPHRGGELPDGRVRRGDIFYADLSPVVGSEQGGLRPVLIIQNDVGNRYSPTVIAAAITSRLGKAKLPTHIDVARAADGSVGLQKDSVILLEQIRTLDKRRLREKMGHLDEDTMRQVNTAISVSIGLSVHPTAQAAVPAAGAGGGTAVVTQTPPLGRPAVNAAASAGKEAAVSPAGLEGEPDKGESLPPAGTSV